MDAVACKKESHVEPDENESPLAGKGTAVRGRGRSTFGCRDNVELRNINSGEVVTFITDGSGRYDFKRLDGNTDYEVWVLFRGKRSVTHSISKFDSHMTKVIDFTVRTY
jgi:hypothetical protein